MKKRFSKLLILSMTTALTFSIVSANAFAEDDASEVSATRMLVKHPFRMLQITVFQN